MRFCQFIGRLVVFFVFMALFFPAYVSCSTVLAQDEDQKSLYVFFVQNQEYFEKDNLTNNTEYNNAVDYLCQALENHTVAEKVVDSKKVKICKDSTNVRNEFEKWLNDLIKEWDDKILEGEKVPLYRFSSSTTFLIVLNGHGAQFGSTYLFKNINSQYETLDGFLSAYEEVVKSVAKEKTDDEKAQNKAIDDMNKAKFVFWVITCRTELKTAPDVSETNVKLGDFKCNILYACQKGEEVAVGGQRIPILETLKEGIAGAADAEGNYVGNEDRFYDGEVSFEEIHKYAVTQSNQRMEDLNDIKKYKAELISSSNSNFSGTILSSVDRAFYTPPRDDDYYRMDRHGEFFEGRAKKPKEEYKGVNFPYELPQNYRYDDRFHGFDFKSGNYWDAYFCGLDLTNAKFSSGKLKRACFDNCILTGATCGGKPITNVDTQKKERFTVEK